MEIDEKTLSPTDPWIESDQFNLARTLRLLGDHQAEIDLLKTVLSRRKKRQAEPQSISNVLINLSVAYRQLNQLDTALHHVYQATIIDQQVKDNRSLLYNDFYNKSLILLKAEKDAEALEAATSMSRFLGSVDEAAHIQLTVVQAQVQDLLGDHKKANSLYEQAYRYWLQETLNQGVEQLAEYLACSHLWARSLVKHNPQLPTN